SPPSLSWRCHTIQGAKLMPLAIIETTISDSTIRMRLADNADPSAATEWVEFVVPLAPLTLPTVGGQDVPLGPAEDRRLATIRLAALRYVRDAIGAETQRLARPPGP